MKSGLGVFIELVYYPHVGPFNFFRSFFAPRFLPSTLFNSANLSFGDLLSLNSFRAVASARRSAILILFLLIFLLVLSVALLLSPTLSF